MADTASEPLGTLTVALMHAERLLARDPRLAEAQAREILKAAPGHPEAVRILGAALRQRGEPEQGAAGCWRRLRRPSRTRRGPSSNTAWSWPGSAARPRRSRR
ncbi:MAG: hypothetical protein WDM92_08445 [Caulobacteraceae bacterium]